AGSGARGALRANACRRCSSGALDHSRVSRMGYSLCYKACAQTFRGCNATAADRAPVLAHLGGFGIVTCSGVAVATMDGGGGKSTGRDAAPSADRLRQDGATQPRVVLSRTVRAGARATARSALRESRDRAAGNTARLVAL